MSLKNGPRYVKMPTLAELQHFDDNEVSQMLFKLQNSIYYGNDMRVVAAAVDRNKRRRYLLTLVLCNDREKADFDTIKEGSSIG